MKHRYELMVEHIRKYGITEDTKDEIKELLLVWMLLELDTKEFSENLNLPEDYIKVLSEELRNLIAIK